MGTARNSAFRDWAPFLVMAFAVLGLVSAYATYAAQIPLERAAARLETLDRTSPPPADIDAQRHAILSGFRQEAEADGVRLRIVIATFTAAAALFGTAVLGIATRERK